MSTANAVSRGMASEGGEASCTTRGNGLHLASLLRRLWPTKTAAELSYVTGASERMCKYWLAQRYDLSGDALANLLRSDKGLDVLEAVMGKSRPAWWRDFKRRTQLGELRREIEEKRKILERLEIAE